MKKIPVILTILFLCTLLVSCHKAGDVRTWSYGSYTVEGEFVELAENGTTVCIRKKDGNIVNIPLSKLSQADQDYVKDSDRPIEGESATLMLPNAPHAGDRVVLKVDNVEFAFRWCPPGKFVMGSPESEPGRRSTEKPHLVQLSKGFWMLETEVTQAQWKVVMCTSLEEQAQKMLNDDTLYKFSSGEKTLRDYFGFKQNETSRTIHGKGDTYPIYYVNWHESMEFCRRLSSYLNLCVQLPTEAQWEYACRAGSTMALPNGPIKIKGKCDAPALDPIAWYGGNSSQGFVGTSPWNSSSWSETQYPGGPCGAHPVGKKDANAWGLYDMLGNVWEWCYDYYDAAYYVRSPLSDPKNTTVSTGRVDRGGSWYDHAEYCRSAYRGENAPDFRDDLLGFRVLLVPGQEK